MKTMTRTGAVALAVFGALGCADLLGGRAHPPPYPASPVIGGVTFDWTTHRRMAPGSDNWPLTWAADGHLYTSWGDGGGFGGTNDDFRVSLGFARVEGDYPDYSAVNVWGDERNSANAASFDGKTRTVLALGNRLYFWRSPGSNVSGLDYQRLYRSDDGAASWADTGVEWSLERDSIGLFAMLQFGRGYEGARDDYVYIYATEILERTWEVQEPGAISLLRVHRDSLEQHDAYRFFTGFGDGGGPTWGGHADRIPVFQDANGVMRNSAIYNPDLDRYLLVTNHTARNEGNVAIFDAPEPWGPWTTVMYESGWPEGGAAERNTFFASLAPKWSWEDGGREFVFVFTGKEDNDAWNTVAGRFELAGEADRDPVS